MPAAEVGPSLLQLEEIRQQLTVAGGWLNAELWGQIPRGEVAVLWTFHTHTASVAELSPDVGITPRVASDTELRIPVKGSVDPKTITPFTFANEGSVFLLDLTELEVNNLSAACRYSV